MTTPVPPIKRDELFQYIYVVPKAGTASELEARLKTLSLPEILELKGKGVIRIKIPIDALIERRGQISEAVKTTEAETVDQMFFTSAQQGLPGAGNGPDGLPKDPHTSSHPLDWAASNMRTEFDLTILAHPLVKADVVAPTPCVVVIFDTVPGVGEFEAAVKKYPDNALLQQLSSDMTANPPKFAIHRHALDLDGKHSNEHPQSRCYRIKSHGLFIAGLIRRLAPHAEIHLFQGMNDFGTTSDDSLRNLVASKEFKDIQERGIDVINFSFAAEGFFCEAMNDPSTPHEDDPGEVLQRTVLDHPVQSRLAKKPQIFWDWYNRYKNWGVNAATTAYAVDVFNDLFFSNTDSNSIPVIAAAGNSNNPASYNPIGEFWRIVIGGRPQPRHPARLKGPISVASLKAAYTSLTGDDMYTIYSNLPNISQNDNEHLSVPGGDGEQADTDNMLLGLYIEDYPDPDKAHPVAPDYVCSEESLDILLPGSNQTGYAYWSGTSFATAIVTGLVARWISNNSDPDRAKVRQEVLKLLRDDAQMGDRRLNIRQRR